MWKRLRNVYSQINQTRRKPLNQPIWQPPPAHALSYQRPAHRRLLPFPVCVIIIDEGSFVITSRQFGIDSCLQWTFPFLVHSHFLERIMMFSSYWNKGSLYPVSRSHLTSFLQWKKERHICETIQYYSHLLQIPAIHILYYCQSICEFLSVISYQFQLWYSVAPDWTCSDIWRQSASRHGTYSMPNTTLARYDAWFVWYTGRIPRSPSETCR